MAKVLVTMSANEIDRGHLIRRVLEERLKQAQAAELLGVGVRQIKRMCRAFKMDGLAGLASRKRGRPSNRRLTPALQARAVALVLERYHDFGPKLAHEKLLELHDVRVGRETLRKWLIEAGVWQTKAQPQSHTPGRSSSDDTSRGHSQRSKRAGCAGGPQTLYSSPTTRTRTHGRDRRTARPRVASIESPCRRHRGQRRHR